MGCEYVYLFDSSVGRWFYCERGPQFFGISDGSGSAASNAYQRASSCLITHRVIGSDRNVTNGSELGVTTRLIGVANLPVLSPANVSDVRQTNRNPNPSSGLLKDQSPALAVYDTTTNRSCTLPVAATAMRARRRSSMSDCCHGFLLLTFSRMRFVQGAVARFTDPGFEVMIVLQNGQLEYSGRLLLNHYRGKTRSLAS